MKYPNEAGCLECRMQLLIYPENILPDKVTEVLGIEPSETAIKGTVSGPNSIGRVRINPNTLWFLISDQHINSTCVAEHIDWMLEKLLSAKSGLDQLRSLPGVKIVFRLTWWTKDGGCWMFSRDQLKKLSQLDFDLEFDIAAYPEEQLPDEE